MEAQSQRGSEANTTVPPYGAWPSVPSRPIEGRVSDNAERNDRPSGMDIDTVVSPTERQTSATSTLSMDDIEAACALEGLRADFAASPRPSTSAAMRSSIEAQHPEPLLSLLTSQHPLLSTAINGSLSAYSSSKSFSPHFKAGAEFVERNIASPVASTVGTAGRISGVETGVRWWLQRSDSTEDGNTNSKRRRIDDGGIDIERGLPTAPLAYRSRATSVMSAESLPAYDDQRSPRYEEEAPTTANGTKRHEVDTPNLRNWQTRLMMSTSGLGVAMSEESLRSLKYCLSWLRWANTHLGKVLLSLQSVLEEWECSQQESCGNEEAESRLAPRDEATIARHIQALKGECLQTLKKVVDVVSKYAGGALPENARVLVRRHLTSLPQRFQIAASDNRRSSTETVMVDSEKQTLPLSQSEKAARDGVTGARKVVVLAREGIDMMAQVSGIVNGTIVSAEEWCERLGRKRVRDTGSITNGDLGEKRTLVARDDTVEDRNDEVSGKGEKEGLVRAVDEMSMQAIGEST